MARTNDYNIRQKLMDGESVKATLSNYNIPFNKIVNLFNIHFTNEQMLEVMDIVNNSKDGNIITDFFEAECQHFMSGEYDAESMLPYKHIIRRCIINSYYSYMSFNMQFREKIFNEYFTWLDYSTRRDLPYNIQVLKFFRHFISSKDLEFVCDICIKKNILCSNLLKLFDKQLSNEQKYYIQANILLKELEGEH